MHNQNYNPPLILHSLSYFLSKNEVLTLFKNRKVYSKKSKTTQRLTYIFVNQKYTNNKT